MSIVPAFGHISSVISFMVATGAGRTWMVLVACAEQPSRANVTVTVLSPAPAHSATMLFVFCPLTIVPPSTFHVYVKLLSPAVSERVSCVFCSDAVTQISSSPDITGVIRLVMFRVIVSVCWLHCGVWLLTATTSNVCVPKAVGVPLMWPLLYVSPMAANAVCKAAALLIVPLVTVMSISVIAAPRHLVCVLLLTLSVTSGLMVTVIWSVAVQPAGSVAVTV